MNASKENAAEALRKLRDLKKVGNFIGYYMTEYEDVERFLEAALKKLPKEESFEKEKTRSKAPKE